MTYEPIRGWIVVEPSKKRNTVRFHLDRDCAARDLQRRSSQQNPHGTPYLSAETVLHGQAQRLGLCGRCKECGGGKKGGANHPERDRPFPGLNIGSPGSGKRS